MHRLSRLLMPILVVLSAMPAFAQIAFPTATPEDAGMSSAKLDKATQALQAHVDAGDIAGAVAGVVRDGKLVYLEAVGKRDIASSAPMTTDALFRIYSMTRPIPSLGILMLQDEGKVNVNDPVQKYLPKFAGQRVLADPNATTADQTRPRKGDITLAELATHTSGFGGRESKIYVDRNMRSWDQSLEQVVDNMASAPLFQDPGTQYRYSEGGDVLGRVIEVTTGMKLQDFYQQRIFGPLGMNDTVFYVDPGRAGRLATTYRPVNGKLQAFEIEPIPVTEHRALISAEQRQGEWAAIAQPARHPPGGDQRHSRCRAADRQNRLQCRFGLDPGRLQCGDGPHRLRSYRQSRRNLVGWIGRHPVLDRS